VEDDRGLRAALQAIVAADGRIVTVVATGREALDVVGGRAVAVVLVDLEADVESLALVSALQAAPSAPDVIVLTGYAGLPSALAAVDAGAAGYLVKPVDAGRLCALVGRALDRRRRLREHAAVHAPAERVRETEALLEIAHALGATLEPERVLEIVADRALTLLGVDRCVVYEVDPRGPMLHARVTRGIGLDAALLTARVGEGAAGAAALIRRPCAVADVGARAAGVEGPAGDPAAPTVREAIDEGAILAAPLPGKDGVSGVLCIYWPEPHAADEGEVRRLAALARQAAVALDNARLYAEARSGEEQATRVRAVTRELASTLDFERVLDMITDKTRDLLGCDAALIFRYDAARDGLVPVHSRGFDETLMRTLVLRPGEGVAGRAFVQAAPAWTRDRVADPSLDYRGSPSAPVRAPHGILAVPIVSRTGVFGVLAGLFDTPHDFTPREVQMLSALADHAAIALDNARLYAEAASRLTSMKRLAQLSHQITSSLDIEHLLDLVTEAARDLLHADFARLWVLNDAGTGLRVAAQRPTADVAAPLQGDIPLGRGLVGWTVQHKTKCYSANVLDDPRVVNKAWLRAAGYVSVLGVPLLIGDRALGAIAVLTRAPREFTREEEELLEMFAAKAATALDNARLYQGAEGRNRELASLHAIAATLTESSDLPSVLDAALERTVDVTGTDAGMIFLYDVERTHLVVAAHEGVSEAYVNAVDRFTPGEGVVGSVALRGTPAIIDNVQTDDRIARPDARVEGLVSVAMVPVTSRRRILGTLFVASRTRRVFTEAEVQLLTSISQQIGLVVERTRVYDAMQAHRTRLTQIFDSTSDGIVLVDRSGMVASANRQAGDLLGFDPAEAVGRDMTGLLARDGVREEAAAALRALVAEPEAGGAGDLELPARGRILHWVGRPTKDAGRATVGLTLTFRDVTDEREIDRLKSDFVSFATHQLRTPLAGIKWMLELAAQEPGVDGDLAGYVSDARESAERLINLVNNLLDISRIESGRLHVAPQPTDLGALTWSVLGDIEGPLRDRGHRLTVVGGDAIPPVMLDPQLIRQVILNLVSNAIKYTTPGGDIEIRMTLDGDGIVWAIRDSGVGIPRDGLRRLFEKFYRADNAVKLETEGTGLGLYLVRLIVERSGGRIWCESEEGKGSTFAFRLPAPDAGSPAR
jgi:PAS domain S-box-containing protein